MYIKVVTVKVKPKGKRAKVEYKYVRVVNREFSTKDYRHKERVICTLGPLDYVRQSAATLIKGLSNLQNE